MSKKLIIFIILIIVIFGGYLFLKPKTSVLPVTQETAKKITLAEIATHNNKDDCWTTINGGVYDVTKFIPNHKGKDKILNACGVDATDMFTGKNPIGRLHSAMAVKLLENFKIGTLQK